MHLIMRWIASALALAITVYLAQAIGVDLKFATSGATSVAITALMASLAIGLVNAIIRPVVQLISLPISCLTLGLFSFVVNALMFWLTAMIVPGFHVGGFVPALFGSIVMSIVSGPLNWALVSAVDRGD
ncbi:MAG TPA: phage holin family protein [Capsulimonadaceae bacterium]|jgi:putative membrane protein